jgi:hypothetical protein
MRRHVLPTLLVAVVFLDGCGLNDPYAMQPPPRARARRAAQAPLPAAPVEPASGAASVLARYATTWVNWSVTTLARERAALLALSAGPLARQLRRDAAQAVKAQLQEVSRAYSRGRYVGVIRQRGGRAIVLTYEEVAPLGGQPQRAYRVNRARTERTAHGWRVSEWQPASDS